MSTRLSFNPVSTAPSLSESSSSPQRSQRQTKKRSLLYTSASVVTLMLSHGVTPAQCFQQVTMNAGESRTATRRFFRDASDSSTMAGDALLVQNPLVVHPHSSSLYGEQQQQQPQVQPSPQPTLPKLPTWLADSKDRLWESNWYKLEQAMLSSFFTRAETQQLLQTIETAANRDRHLMASAAEFCLILVETMEMGLTALMAASYHVTACVHARLQQQQSQAQHHPHQQHSPMHNNVMDYTSLHHAHSHHGDDVNTNNNNVQDQALMIAKDAGRLKKLEMVAAMIYSQKSAHRVTPDAQDAENLRSLLLSETKDWRALAIRTAAALYRLRGILNHARKTQPTGVGAREMETVTPEALRCSREALYIYAPLASRLGMHRLKNELEGAAFRILYRRQHEKVNRLARELRPRHSKPHLNRGLVEMCDNSLHISACMKSVLESVKVDMTRLLSEDPYFSEHVAEFSVTARVKEPYSLWKKMLRNKCQHIMEVPDAIALRIVLDAKVPADVDERTRRNKEIELCYYAQQLCMQHWHPVANNPRFKDYIESPKRNGYQSLHYTAHTMWDQEDWNLEIQVRSGEMHQVAEFGLASHWDYKSTQTSGQKKKQQQDRHHHHHADGYYGGARPHVTIHEQSVSDVYLRSVQECGHSQPWHVEDFIPQSSSSFNAPLPSTSPPTQEAVERASRIRARTKNLQPYIEALTAAQSDLAREHVFVFLTTPLAGEQGDDSMQPGTVLALPAGSCVLDALRQGERQLGIEMPDEIRLNGEWSNHVTAKLQNGDILTVPLAYRAMA